MKKILLILIICFYNTFFSQIKNVGINNNDPGATLDISNKTTTNPVFRIGSSSGNSNHLFRVMPSGFLMFGNSSNTTYPVSIYPLNDTHADFAVKDASNPNLFLKHYHMMSGAELTSYGVNFSDRSGHVFVFSSGGMDSGFFIGPYTDTPSGIYIGENGKNGVGITTKPTETLDIGGNLRISSQATTSTRENGTCDKPGEIVYSSGSFWGCTSLGWKKIDN